VTVEFVTGDAVEVTGVQPSAKAGLAKSGRSKSPNATARRRGIAK
jgi:hypothetical protein